MPRTAAAIWSNVRQEIDSEEPGHLCQGALCQRGLRRVSDRIRLEDCHRHRREQIQPQQLLVRRNKTRPVGDQADNHRNGRWRSLYTVDPSSGNLEGSIKVDVHYYEDGNVRLLTNKAVSASIPSGTGAGIAKEISASEKKYQEELNRGFVNLSEGAFKGLRRQLPVTRQKIEWDKVASYRLGQDIGGGSSKR